MILDTAANSGQTPLQWAAQYNAVDCLTVLLAQGADPTTVDNNGETPLQIAKRTTSSTAAVARLEAAMVEFFWGLLSLSLLFFLPIQL